MIPSVGRVVLYSPDFNDREIPAIVVAVGAEMMRCNLRVLPDSELPTFHAIGAEYSETPKRNTWRWPPRVTVAGAPA